MKAFFLLLLFGILPGRAAVLEWDPNPEANVIGYNVYWGLATRTYSSNIMVLAPLTTATITNLHTGTNYFAVTAIDDLGLESDFSDEVWLLVKPTRPTGVKLAPTLAVRSAPSVLGPWSTVVSFAGDVSGSRFFKLAIASTDPEPEPVATARVKTTAGSKVGKL